MTDEVQKSIKITIQSAGFVEDMKEFHEVPIKASIDVSIQVLRELLKMLPKEERKEIYKAIKTGDIERLFERFNI